MPGHDLEVGNTKQSKQTFIFLQTLHSWKKGSE